MPKRSRGRLAVMLITVAMSASLFASRWPLTLVSNFRESSGFKCILRMSGSPASVSRVAPRDEDKRAGLPDFAWRPGSCPLKSLQDGPRNARA